MNDRLKCKVCGRYFYQEATITSSVGFDFREKVCPECKRARAFSGNGNSGSGNGNSILGGIAGGIAGAAAANKAAAQAALDKLRTLS
ncbi:MAG: hypothetical protein K5786_04920, partial [Treponema sp.]|nr:hypothetical protein [Treponema sp.]